MENVNKWGYATNLKTLEDKVKFNIASQCEGYLNGCHDCGYEPMTKKEWSEYIYKGMQDEFEVEDGCYTGKQAGRQLHFFGKKKTLELIDVYLDNYEGVQEFIKPEVTEQKKEEYKFFTVKFMLDPREQKALEELLPYYQQYKAEDSSRPFEKWTVEDVFRTIMETGSKFVIADKIQFEQFRQGLIDWDDREKDGFKTIEERRCSNGSGED